ncbi:hypothetical protein [Thiobacillus sedimenti]|uniref:EF-hand domain-containing protein n=1 Tax=Thiobacillus sedimenti TaxID=3110231 RepID=A0ABZ1CGY7_9PROT|nr:hypothetical protein [Thiobacillus sp. SCUT-2]WRS38481.1 hypothetical protein VA613_10750 [Thiobacillus sp. SCUT-2]
MLDLDGDGNPLDDILQMVGGSRDERPAAPCGRRARLRRMKGDRT